MKIRHRLSLQYTLISGILLLAVFALIYLLSAQYIQKSFYRILQGRALITAQVFLEKDELTKKKFRELEERYQERIPNESSNIYDQDDRPVFIEKIKYNWPPSLLETIRQRKIYRFRMKDKQALGLFYPDNQGDYVVIITARNKSGMQQLQYLVWILAGTFCLGLLILFFTGQWFARRALQPVKRINGQMKVIRSSNLDMRVSKSRNKDEIDELADNFNQLLERLEAAFERQKSFVSNASHELRTPLTTIIGEIEVTLQRERGVSEYVETLRTVLDESEKLRIITQGLLELTRPDVLPDPAHQVAIRLDEWLWEEQAAWAQQVPSATLEVVMEDMPEDAAQLIVYGNRQLLHLALHNIIKNGFKFSHMRPVSCKLTWSVAGMLLSVSDTGIGIAPSELDRIFMPLFRGSNAHEFDGYGIGLAMAQKILGLHHATITVQSWPGQGTTFNILFAANNRF